MTELSVTTTDNQTVSDTEAKIAEFLEEHQEIEMVLPVAIGLFVTSRFGLRGANALLANLLIAGISRQIFLQLKKNKTKSITTAQSSQIPVQILPGYQIVHSVPGRIRLKVERLADDALFAKRLERLLNEYEHVIQVRVNRAACSVVIHYTTEGTSEMALSMGLLNIISRAEKEETITSPGADNSQVE